MKHCIQSAAAWAAAALTAAAAVAPAWGQASQPAAATAPSTAPARPKSLVVVIDEVVGAVQVNPDGSKWMPAKVGMRVGEGAAFRTGIRSSVTCVIPPDQTFKLESLGTVRVAEAIKQGTVTRTELIMKYGATSYGIEAAGAEYDARIRTPSSTLAVRGTVVRVNDQPPFAPTAESFTGRALYRTAQRETRLGGTRYAQVNAVQGSAAETALSQSVVDPAAARARSNSEARFIANQVSLGATANFDETTGIPVIRGGAGPHADEGLAESLPGRLNFALRWSGNANLDFVVDNQPGDQAQIIFNFQPQELLFPGYGLNVSTTGGLIPFDHRGGPNGGQEIAFWENSFPTGIYGVGVIHSSGQPTDFAINAFLDKQPLTIFSIDDEGTLLKYRTYRGNLARNGTDAAIIPVPVNALFDQIATSADPDIPDDAIVETAVRQALARINANPAPVASAGPTGASRAALAGPRTADAEQAADRARTQRDAEVARLTDSVRNAAPPALGRRAGGEVPFARPRAGDRGR